MRGLGLPELVLPLSALHVSGRSASGVSSGEWLIFGERIQYIGRLTQSKSCCCTSAFQ